MPPKCKFTREEVIHAAMELTRAEGFKTVTARSVGGYLHSSSKVIFSLFKNMEELQNEVLKAADALYQRYLKEEMASGKYPPYKASGMAYIHFAKEEKELFRLLFMRDRSQEAVNENTGDTEPLIKLIQQNTGLNEQDAYIFHLEMWVYVHGIATMLVTGYLMWDWDFIDRMLTDVYEGVKSRYLMKEVK